jgi:hypothetical protein
VSEVGRQRKTCYFPDIGAGGWQTTEKSTMKRECLVLRQEHSLFAVKNKSLSWEEVIEKFSFRTTMYPRKPVM